DPWRNRSRAGSATIVWFRRWGRNLRGLPANAPCAGAPCMPMASSARVPSCNEEKGIVVTNAAAPARTGKQASADAIAELTAAFGNRLVTSMAVREQHANTTTWIENQPPDAVVFPQDAGDVQTIVRISARHRMPVIAFGTGTSLEGHINA